MGRLVAFDFGPKRVGIAVTDPLQIIATPLNTLSPKEAEAWLKAYAAAEQVDTVVVGLPVQPDGSPSTNYASAQGFMQRLAHAHPDLQVLPWDERYTSVMAHQALRQGGATKKQRKDKALVDKVSASLILQSYMQRHTP